jgi:hypothetical protein
VQVLRGLGLEEDEESMMMITKTDDFQAPVQSNCSIRSRRRLCFSPRQRHALGKSTTTNTATLPVPNNSTSSIPSSPPLLAAAAAAAAASPLGLLEELFADNPWRLLLSAILLNRTRRIQVDSVMYTFLQQWPTPEATIEADVNEMSHRIAPLGIKYRRAKGIVQFSKDYLGLVEVHSKQQQQQQQTEASSTTATTSTSTTTSSDNKKKVTFQWTRSEILNLFHCGDYAADAYQIFIQRDWQTIQPRDHALLAYVEWKRSVEAY